ncbi:hypothetical protein Pelo_2796 [Pelomyxa schiedti]|nr:hypothetical protein Pelo_2796 [Pelomyxa schiedti]
MSSLVPEMLLPPLAKIVHKPTIIIDRVVRSRIPATLTVRVQQEWRAQFNLSEADVFEAVRNVQFCTADTLVEKLCWKCNKANGKVAQVVQLDDKPMVEQFREKFSFQVKAICTSSRDHLCCELAAVVNFPNYPETVVSPSFHIRSRQPSKKTQGRHSKSPADIQSSPKIVTSSESILNLSPLTPSTPIRCSPDCSPILPAQTWKETFNQPIVVRLLLFQLPRESTEALVRHFLDSLGPTGYEDIGLVNLSIKFLDSNKVGIASQGFDLQNDISDYTGVVLAATYKSAHHWSLGRSKLLEVLTNKERNTLNTDLVATGAVQFLAVFTSW